MRENFVRRHKKSIIIIVVVLLLIIFVGYIFAPNMDGIIFRIDPSNPSVEDIKRNIEDGESEFLQFSNSYWSSNSIGGIHIPSEKDVFFTFDEIVKLDDGIYITDGWGITNWCARVRVYSRKDYMLENPRQMDDGSYSNWPFYIKFRGADKNEFPHKRNMETFLLDAFWGYSSDIFLAAPAKIDEDGTVTLVYHTGKDYSEQKEVKVPVSIQKMKSRVSN